MTTEQATAAKRKRISEILATFPETTAAQRARAVAILASARPKQARRDTAA